jgi:hypothetical protein
MPSYTDEELLTETEIRTLDPNIRQELKEKRALQRTVDELAAKQAESERQVAFWRAGVPSDAKGQFFAAGYQGDLDPVAIKAKYDEVFGDGTGVVDPNAGKTAEELAAAQRTANAGGEVVGVPGTVSLEDAIKNAKTNEEVMEILRNAPPEAGIRIADHDQ